MYLYGLTLQPATAITTAVYGNFSAPKVQEIIVARGKILELLRPDEAGKMHSILSQEIFGIIRAIAPFRLTGGNKDYIVVASDSGRIVILEYNAAKNAFDRVHCETYGKSGCRRITAGQYLAVDPRGRSILIAGVEKQKFVYVINRDSTTRLTISSPLEAHKSHTVLWTVAGIDNGFENPIFATLEVDYGGPDDDLNMEVESTRQKQLVFYELDLGLNHVVRKWSDTVDNSANMLVTVPGGNEGPGGVLVCCENFVVYKNANHPDRKCLLPRRQGQNDERGTLIISYATHKQKDLFFFILQSEYGDLYKVTLVWESDTDKETDVVNEVKVKYFDTIPTSNSICVMKHGFLFAAAEFGNHALYQFQGIGEEDDAPEESSNREQQQMQGEGGDMLPPQYLYFRPRHPKNLLLTDDIESLAPIIDFKVADVFGEDTKQFFAACGRGIRSTLRILRHGLTVTEMAVSELPGNPSAVWTVKRSEKDEFDKYIVVSFLNATLVLSIGETVEEVTDSGFLATSPTIAVTLLGEDSLLQIHPNGIRHIRADRRIQEWKPPGKKSITKAGLNQRQVVIALSGGELVHFELDMTGQLNEMEKKDMGQEITALAVGPLSAGRSRSRFLAVGCVDNSVRVMSLDMEDHLHVLALQMLPSAPESIAIVDMLSGAGGGVDAGGMTVGTAANTTLYLNIGLQNGVLQRTVLDPLTGTLSDTRQRFLGSRPIKLFKAKIGGSAACLALSSRSWVVYTWQTRVMLTPLSYESLEHASSFSSEQCPEGLVAIAGNTLRIVTLERLGGVLNETAIPLRYTPRKMLQVAEMEPNRLQTKFVVMETEHNRYTAFEQKALVDATKRAVKPEGEGTDAEAEEEKDIEFVVATAPAGHGHWASCIRLLDVPKQETLQLIEMDNNEAAFSMCTAVFHGSGDLHLVVGTVKDLTQQPRGQSGGFLYVYRFSEDRRQLLFVHKTPVDDVPYAVCSFQGRLLAGVGRALRIYDMGKRKLLRKCENKNLPNLVTTLYAKADRIYAGDINESISFLKYKRSENQLYVFADDINPRWMTSMVYLDYDTIAGADKFGNVFIDRLPSEVSDEVEDDPTGSGLKFERGYLNGAPHKLENINNYFVGEIVNSLTKGTIQPGGKEALIYSTLNGAIGALLPFQSREDVDFFSHLEMHLRQENPPLCGRDHLSFRSYYYPVKEVIDGDLCETYTSLPYDKQRAIADELDRTPAEVAKKLEDIRNLIL
mmetsp:Transcript_5908/g.9597  ORF Transcript_5908/g.9597 Transcript_5908/m.9597 type:complete len:1230 (-) Transcript_5908:259-3948(-)